MADERVPRPSFFRRRRTWLVLLGVLVVVRAALPEVIRRVARSQVAKTLQTRVEIGDVDLSFLRGGVALEDVALYSPTPETPDEPPLVAWKRFAVSLRYLPLFRKTVQLRQIALEDPRVALDRLADGELNLRRLAPASEAPPGEAPAGEPPADAAPSTWSTGIDRFTLRGGGVRFRDLTLAGGEPLEIAIPDITVDEVALQPGVYGEPGRLNVRVKTEGGSVWVDSKVWVLDQGFAASTRVKAFRMPLRRARLYVPGMGWSELQGVVDAVVDHGLAPGGKNALDATIRVRDVAIRVPDLPNAALAVRRLAVRIAPLDLATRRVRVREVDLAGASVVVDLHTGGGVLPVVRGGKAASPPADGAPAPAAESPPTTPPASVPPAATEPAREPAPAAEPAPATEPPPPFHWAVDTVRLTDSKVSFLQEGEPLDIGVEATVEDLVEKGDPGRLDVKLAVASGSVAVAGALRPIPPAFGGTLRIDQLPVHDLVRAARAAAQLPPGLTKHAVLGVDLALEAGITADGAAATPETTVRAKGKVGIDALEMEGPDPAVFAVAWKRFEVPIDALEVPGALPGAPADALPDTPGQIKVVLGAVRLEEPSVRLTRAAEGLLLPPPLGGSPSADGAAPAPAAGAPAPPPTDAKPAPVAAVPPAGPAAPAPDVTVASFVLTKGRISVVDRSVTPHFTAEIKPLDISARGIRSAGPSVDQLTLTAATPAKGKLTISGSVKPDSGTIKVNADALALAPYNPYVTTFSPYSLGRASGVSVKTDVKYGKGKYDTKTALTLHKLTVKGAAGDTAFKQQFGIPLSMALALLRDPSGNIKLDIPVAVDESGTKIGLGTVVAGALRSALLGAVTSPLKAVGFALGSGDGEAALEPPPIPMEVGRAVLTPDGEKQVGQLAEFLGSRPGVGLELDGVVTAADARWLKEQALRAELESRKGVGSALRDLPERRVRGRVVAALGERAAGKDGEIDEDDQVKLDEWLAERSDVGPDGLAKLSQERGAAVATLLRERHGIPEARVAVGDSKGELREGAPSVVIAFGGADE